MNSADLLPIAPLFRCPTLARSYRSSTGKEVPNYGNYGMSCALGISATLKDSRYNRSRKIQAVPNLSKTVLLSENGGEKTIVPTLNEYWIVQAATKNGVYKGGVHGGANNVLWCDGHVSSWSDVKTLVPQNTYIGSPQDKTWAPGFDILK